MTFLVSARVSFSVGGLHSRRTPQMMDYLGPGIAREGPVFFQEIFMDGAHTLRAVVAKLKILISNADSNQNVHELQDIYYKMGYDVMRFAVIDFCNGNSSWSSSGSGSLGLRELCDLRLWVVPRSFPCPAINILHVDSKPFRATKCRNSRIILEGGMGRMFHGISSLTL